MGFRRAPFQFEKSSLRTSSPELELADVRAELRRGELRGDEVEKKTSFASGRRASSVLTSPAGSRSSARVDPLERASASACA